MLVDCSEININVIVKRVQHVWIIWACSLPGMDLLLSFSVPEGTERIAGLIGGLAGLLGGDQYLGWHYIKSGHLTSLKSQIFSMVANIQPSSEKSSG